MDVFTEIVTPSLLFDEHLSSLVVCRLVTLSLEHGNCDGSGFAYVWLAMFAGPRFNNYPAGFRFGQLGYDLVEKRGLTRYQARTYMSIGAMVKPWAEHAASGRELVRRAFDAAYRIGDLTFASYSWDQLITILAAGDPLAEVQTEAENGLAFAKRVRFGLVVELCGAQLGLIRTLRGLTPGLGFLDHEITARAKRNVVSPATRIWCSPILALDAQVAGALLCRRHPSAAEASLKRTNVGLDSAAMFEGADSALRCACTCCGLGFCSSRGEAEAFRR